MTPNISNSDLAARLSALVDRWNTRENQMIALLTQPEGQVTVTDGVGQNHSLPSFPQLQADVALLTDDLTGAVAEVRDISSAMTGHVSAAAQSAADAATSAAEAGTAQSEAAAAQSAAQSAAADASQYAASASQARTQASASADAAASAADSAVDAAGAAEEAAAVSVDAADLAWDYANAEPGVPIDGGYSARHWADEARTAAAGAMSYKGPWDASTGVYPPSPAVGHLYIISVAGTISGVQFREGDQLIYNGTTWARIPNVQAVTSVAGRTGDVVLSAADIASGTLAASRIPALPTSKITGLDTALAGKAPAQHTHAAEDITSGTLAVERGGLGRGEWTTGSFLYASSGSTIGERTPAQARAAMGAADVNHSHVIGDVSGLQAALGEKMGLTEAASAGLYATSGNPPTAADLAALRGLTSPRFGRIISSTAGAPFSWGTYIQAPYSGASGAMLAMSTTTNVISWSPNASSWMELYHTGNANPPNKTGDTYSGTHKFAGTSTMWGIAPTGGLQVDMGTASGATWLLAGFSAANFRFGIQVHDSGDACRFYVNGGFATLTSAGEWNAGSIPRLDASKIDSGTLPVARGGTGGSTKAAARTGIGIHVQSSAPTSPAEGDLWVW